MAGNSGNNNMAMWMQLLQFQQQQAQLQSQQLNAQQMREPVIQAQVSADTAQMVRQFSSPYSASGAAISIPFSGMTQGYAQKAA